MDHRETFVLTLFCDPQRSADLRGRLRHVASNREATFKSLEELAHLLHRFAIDEKETRDDEKGT